MSDLTIWLLAFGALLVAYCLYWGVAQGHTSARIDDYFLADRQTPAWLFVLTATALSVTGWLAIGHPSMVTAFGFPYAEVALGAIGIPLAGILFLKRQWMLGRHYGYKTPASMFGAYYSAELLRWLTVLIALVFAIPFVGMQLAACGRLIEQLTGSAVDRDAATWIVAFSIFVYVYLGGMRALTAAGALQCMLLVAGMIGIGCLAYAQLGGFGAFNAALAAFGAQPDNQAARALFEIPGVVQFTAGLGKETPAGGIWTASMILSYALALMGIQASPSFSMLAFASRDTRGFAAQQVWASGAIVGLVLVLFAVAQGFGVHLASGAAPIDPTTSYLEGIAAAHPWLAALLAICIVAAIQVAAAAYVWTTAAMLSIDIVQRHIRPQASERALRICARAAMALIFVVALMMATYTPLAQVQLGGLALSFALQLWPVLAGVCWLPWITRQGATLGLAAGLVAVLLTEPVGASITRFFGFDLPWGRWPWTIHSAGWGIFCNLLVCGLVSLGTRGGESRRQREEQHRFLRTHDVLAPRKHVMRPAVWALTLGWMFFAIGPGAVIGNDLFGDPNAGLAAWKLGIPSLWAWQIIWWALGVFVIWWLAYKMELATAPRGALEDAR